MYIALGLLIGAMVVAVYACFSVSSNESRNEERRDGGTDYEQG